MKERLYMTGAVVAAGLGMLYFLDIARYWAMAGLSCIIIIIGLDNGRAVWAKGVFALVGVLLMARAAAAIIFGQESVDEGYLQGTEIPLTHIWGIWKGMIIGLSVALIVSGQLVVKKVKVAEQGGSC